MAEGRLQLSSGIMRNAAMLILAATALVTAQQTAHIPAITAIRDEIKVAVGGPGKFKVQMADGTETPVLLETAMEAMLSQAVTEAVTEAQTTSEQISFNLGVDLRAELAAEVSNLSAIVAVERSDRIVAEASLMEEIADLTEAVEMMQPTVMCPDYPTSLARGTVSGSGREAGAVRVVHCDPGTHITGSTGTIVCHVNGRWSDHSSPTQCVTATAPPTPEPLTTETVTCCAIADNQVIAVYADGVRIPMRFTTGRDFDDIQQFRFSSATQVLGIEVKDNEQGCEAGGLFMMCSTPSGQGPWNIDTPTAHYLAISASANASFYRHWSAKTINATRGFIGADIPYERPQFAMDPRWAQVSYDAARNGFEPVVPRSGMSSERGRDHESRISPININRFANAAAVGFDGNRLPRCPRVLSNQPNHFDNTLERVGGVCAGYSGNVYNYDLRHWITWLFRIDVTRR